ncbi:MAG TPA: patatin-like phospholipase family protein [Burkholderiales bacterium]|jgi:NTE family protein|nr:patatin-like phospholipase family protein [Burkholderiales bacterium]
MKRTLVASAALAAGLTLFTVAAIAQTASGKATPRVGLALSGGGARGLAHIGVLKVLEELRVPVNCVTGTSMGAIVGGAYAAGATAAELDEFVRKADWDDVFRDSPPRAEISTRRKVDDYKTLFAPEYGIRPGSLFLPKGLIAGVSIEGFFRQLTQQAVEVGDFDKLPIPFRAVAADIETGEAVVLSRGSLSRAMRASMSVPGAIAPVEIDGRLLVDGGIANNLPIDEARKLCGDVVIAVNISTPAMKREAISSALTVGTQLINFLGKANVERQIASLGPRDVLIAPELGDISAGSFNRAGDAIRVGEEAARALAQSLGRYSLPPAEYEALRRRQIAESKPVGAVDEIRFEGLRRTNPEALRALLETKPGEPLTEEKVGADLRRIYGRGDYESVDYRIQQESGRRVMVIQPVEKEWGPNYFRFGLGLATDFQGENNFNLLAQYRNTWLNRLGGEWLTEAQVGRQTFLATEFMQPVEERGRWFVAPYARVGNEFRYVFSGDDKVAEYQTKETRVGLDGGSYLGTWGEARLGLVWRRVDAHTETGLPILPDVDETTAGLRALFLVDQLDNAWFARSGYRLAAAAYAADEGLGSDRNYQRLDGELTAVRSWGAHTVNFKISGGTDFHSDMPAYENFTLGGPLRLSGYRIDQFSGRQFGFSRLMYYNRAIHLPDILGSGVFVGASIEAGQMQGRAGSQSTTGTLWSGSVFLAASTFAGPAYFGFGFGETGHYSLYLLLGAP